MSFILMSIGAGIVLFLGLAHGVFTLQSSVDGGPMMPTDPDVRDAMQVRGGIGMAPDIDSNLFRAWIGFNFSHSLGIVVIAGVILWHTLDDVAVAVEQPWFLAVVFVVPVVYLVLAQLYWFSDPRNAIFVATLLLWAGTIIELVN